jgi:hypothetical protein
MCEKTVKRRLARDMPMSVLQSAAALDGLQDRGEAAYLDAKAELHSTAEGPEAKGVIIDVAPENILSEVNWPKPKTPKQFFTWSTEYLETATMEQATAWHEQYKDTLLGLHNHPVEAVRDALADLLLLYGERSR